MRTDRLAASETTISRTRCNPWGDGSFLEDLSINFIIVYFSRHLWTSLILIVERLLIHEVMMMMSIGVILMMLLSFVLFRVQRLS